MHHLGAHASSSSSAVVLCVGQEYAHMRGMAHGWLRLSVMQP